ncbi:MULTISPECIES: DUF5336 domain-containing protein [unclassified Amycolatopsis]|uniref:DUF5336 domain-containing protein n=1 Tax=unclassified Amycolatopsis TaxID=2618356 RepID=UPI0028747112|nr:MULTISPECIES: DUF5336 domain-containing protein [unclassified Amycolatopsis]MDS0132285.1 DUF5336 domain-containing protein [Amycolatopsis sp. 505]MDS0142891.1 DUF5336 domain-containing protein [Amycolatopsis sp. CM201R]
MTFPSGGPGYPQQGGGQQPPGPPSSGFPAQQQPPHSHQASAGGAGLPQNLPLLLALVVAGLGLVQYFLGFSDNGEVGLGGTFLLGGGLLAGMTALPKGPKTLPFAALFSVLGALEVLDTLVGMQTSPGIVTVILILGILQMLAAVAALLIAHDVIKPPAPKPAAPSYGGQYGQQQFGQQGQGQGQQFGQPGHGPGPVAPTGEPSAPFSQPGQYGSPNPPSTTPPPGQQATTYAPQQGSFFQQPPPENPGTPPGGFGKSN